MVEEKMSENKNQSSYTIDIHFKFEEISDEDGKSKWMLTVFIPGSEPFKAELRSDRYDLKLQFKKLMEVKKIIPMVELDTDATPLRKELFITMGRILLTLLEYY